MAPDTYVNKILFKPMMVLKGNHKDKHQFGGGSQTPKNAPICCFNILLLDPQGAQGMANFAPRPRARTCKSGSSHKLCEKFLPKDKLRNGGNVTPRKLWLNSSPKLRCCRVLAAESLSSAGSKAGNASCQ